VVEAQRSRAGQDVDTAIGARRTHTHRRVATSSEHLSDQVSKVVPGEDLTDVLPDLLSGECLDIGGILHGVVFIRAALPKAAQRAGRPIFDGREDPGLGVLPFHPTEGQEGTE
jgi:hypothetical protein